jgi:preprotein translocase subunit SecF
MNDTKQDLDVKEVKEEDLKMKASVFVGPKTGKQITVAILMLIVILISIVPFINLVNIPKLWFGMPALMFWSIVITLATFVVMQIAIKWKVH